MLSEAVKRTSEGRANLSPCFEDAQHWLWALYGSDPAVGDIRKYILKGMSEFARNAVANSCFASLLDSREFKRADRPKSVLKALYSQWEKYPAKALSPSDLADMILRRDDEDSQALIRSTIKDIREKLLKYFAAHPGQPIRLEIATDQGYRLEVKVKLPSEDQVRLIFKHRDNTSDWFRDTLCSPADDLLFVTIASHNTLDRITPWFKKNAVRVKHFRVLTWQPESEPTICAWADSRGEDRKRIIANVAGAWKTWKELEAAHACLEVYSYASTPTLQAVCGEKEMTVEILLFNRAGGHGFHESGWPNQRPGLFLSVVDHPASYWIFRNSFEDLWLAAMLEAREQDVHDRWREERRRILLEHNLPTT